MGAVLDRTIELAKARYVESEARERHEPAHPNERLTDADAATSPCEQAVMDYLESLTYEQVRAIEVVRAVGKLSKSVSIEAAAAVRQETDKDNTIVRLAESPTLAAYLLKGRERLGDKIPAII